MSHLTRPTAVYALKCPETLECRYIGISVNPTARYKRHLADCVSSVYDWAQELKQRGLQPVFEELAWFDDRWAAIEHEDSLIKATDGLLNLSKHPVDCQCPHHFDIAPAWAFHRHRTGPDPEALPAGRQAAMDIAAAKVREAQRRLQAKARKRKLNKQTHPL